MKNERSTNRSAKVRSLDQRLSDSPELAEMMHALLDEMEASLAQDALADEVEERVEKSVRKLGQGTLAKWAEQAQEKGGLKTPHEHPQAVKHAKKNFPG